MAKAAPAATGFAEAMKRLTKKPSAVAHAS
jgi:hypothetical protein